MTHDGMYGLDARTNERVTAIVLGGASFVREYPASPYASSSASSAPLTFFAAALPP
jgi:hypothetical protein